MNRFTAFVLWILAGIALLAWGSSADMAALAQSPGAPTVITPDASRHPTQLPPQSYGREPGEPYGSGQNQPYGSQPYGNYPPQSHAQPESEQKNTFSMDEITATGHRFFGTVSKGLAKVIEHAFAKAGRPNGYILGEEAGGAIVVGLRYGEGMLYTRNAGQYKVFWQGPSLGYDFGAEGSKTMILVYNLRHPGEIYNTFGGVDGSAYFIGGVGITFQVRDHVTLAPIRSGVGLRLGANVGYLKYTRQPTWNPF